MKLPVLNKYYSVNALMYLITFEFAAFWGICILRHCKIYSNIFTLLLALKTNYLFWIIIMPICIFSVIFELLFRKFQNKNKFNIVTLSQNQIRIIYLIIFLMFIILLTIHYLCGKPPTPEELRYD